MTRLILRILGLSPRVGQYYVKRPDYGNPFKRGYVLVERVKSGFVRYRVYCSYGDVYFNAYWDTDSAFEFAMAHRLIGDKPEWARGRQQ